MIHVHFPPAAEEAMHVRVTGHAGTEAKGRDVVCSAVSTLLLTCLGGAEEVLAAEVTGQFEEGFCDVVLRVPKARKDHLRIVGEIFRHGFRKLAVTYPERVNLIEGGMHHGA